jgi:hypothetical protein
MGPLLDPLGKNFSHLMALATMYDTSGLRLGKSVVKFIFFHLNRFFMPRDGGSRNLSRLSSHAQSTLSHLKNVIIKKSKLTLRLNINILGVFLLLQLRHLKHLRIPLNIKEHMRVLIAPEPLIFPVKPNGRLLFQHAPQRILILQRRVHRTHVLPCQP